MSFLFNFGREDGEPDNLEVVVDDSIIEISFRSQFFEVLMFNGEYFILVSSLKSKLSRLLNITLIE